MRIVHRGGALLEVTLVLALTHTAWRWIVRETAWGRFEAEHRWNFIPGACLATAALAMLLVGRLRRGARSAPIARKAPSDPSSVSPTLPPPPATFGFSLLGAVVAALLTFAAGGILVPIGLLGMRPPFYSAIEGLVALIAGGVVALVLAHALTGASGAWLARRSRLWGISLLAAVILAPLAKALVEGGSIPQPVVANVAWRLFGAALGEELFFRGYVQGRLDRSFGTPWRVAGTAIGPGLLIASLLFGLLHLVNPFDFATGEGRLAWGHALATAGTLSYGFLRARTGSLVAPVALHAIVDLVAVTIRQ